MSEPYASLPIRRDSLNTVPVPQNGSYITSLIGFVESWARLIMICASFGGSMPR